jgi:protein import protein ZIM17
MMFTCGRCETRAAKGFSRQAYDNGVVIVRCPGCQTQHLVADRYGWFGEPGSVEDFLRDRGDVVARTREEGIVGNRAPQGSSPFLTESEDGTIEADEAAVKAWMDRVKATAVERAHAGGEGGTDDGRG